MNLNNKKFYKIYPVGTILISRHKIATNINRIVIVNNVEGSLFNGKILLTDIDNYMLGKERVFSFSHFELF